MENFKQEFKIYCMTTDNVEGLRVIKKNLFDKMLNLETFIDDYINIDLLKASNKEIVNEACNLASILKGLAEKASYIDSFELREIYNLISNYDYEYLKDVFEYAMGELSEFIYSKYNINPFRDEDLTEEQLKKEIWFTSLCDLLDKYNIC